MSNITDLTDYRLRNKMEITEANKRHLFLRSCAVNRSRKKWFQRREFRARYPILAIILEAIR